MAAIRRTSKRYPSKARLRRPAHTWTRRLHFYIGLYLLLFIWLFAITGLLLNHPKWEATHNFWESREENTFERMIIPPPATDDLAKAKALMQQLDFGGEINQANTDPTTNRFSFQVSRPGELVNVDADLDAGRAVVTQIRVNAFGVLDALHKFSGVSMRDLTRDRDWWLTRIWSVAMDAVAVGLIVLAASGLYLWYGLKAKRLAGIAALAAGTAVCWFFLAGLVRLF